MTKKKKVKKMTKQEKLIVELQHKLSNEEYTNRRRLEHVEKIEKELREAKSEERAAEVRYHSVIGERDWLRHMLQGKDGVPAMPNLYGYQVNIPT